MKKFLALSLSDVVFIMPINVKMPLIVGILIFMSRINLVMSLVEHGKSFITSGPDVGIIVRSRTVELGLYDFQAFEEPSGSMVEC